MREKGSGDREARGTRELQAQGSGGSRGKISEVFQLPNSEF